MKKLNLIAISMILIPRLMAQCNVTVNSLTTCSSYPQVITASGGSTYYISSAEGLPNNNMNSFGPSGNQIDFNGFFPSITSGVITFTVTIPGCSGSANGTITRKPSPSFPTGNRICVGNSITLIASGSSTYLWSTGSTTNSITVSPIINTSYSVTGTNGCIFYDSVRIYSNPLPSPTPVNTPLPTPVLVNVIDAQCTTNNGSASVGNGVATYSKYSWSNGETTNPAINLSIGTYSLTLTFKGGCYITKSFVIDNSKPPTIIPICLVTVDSSSTHNIIIWEKPITTVTDSFAIYREVTTGGYSKIATIPYDSLSEYNDLSANPNVTAYTYKMTVIDTCGNESAMSAYHSTINLQSLGNGNFQWTLYEIENQSNPVTYYKLNRDDNGTGNFLPISATIPGTNTTYTDVNSASFPNARYYMEAVWSISCTPSRSVSTTRSNTKSLNTTGIVSQNEFENGIVIYPNPASTKVNITLPEILSKTDLTIINVLSETVYSQIITSKTTTINIENFAKGVYTMVVNINGNKVFKKLIVD